MQELRGKRALVTGATSGIGRATAEALAREGAHALISGCSEARGAEVVAAIEAAGGQAEFVRADLELPGDVRALAERARRASWRTRATRRRWPWSRCSR
jgi:NAD(P)-dependent dehydrogenase (short-subunit alcohol dehydrogenase family)